ncbi:interleukin-17F-like [Xyrauchen texanus]|uniref:interleukin-17F-like n=1 Tax=Xyrauchen texanus TaxID=154827 RepID=UPI0022428742|nr:interleukin-17F-like [Xyrauchen texanus]
MDTLGPVALPPTDTAIHRPLTTVITSVFPRYIMQQQNIFGLLSIFLLVLDPSQCNPITAQCMEHTYCSSTLKEYHAQLISLPSRINERSVAAWSYEDNIDMDRVPQIISEAHCLNSHSCKGVDSSFSLEAIPIAIKMPFLRKNPRCPTYALEFEDVNIACICATSRQN